MFPDLNYQTIGQALGISPVYVGRILNGHSRPSMELAARFAAYMGWSIDQLNSFYRPQNKKIQKSKGK